MTVLKEQYPSRVFAMEPAGDDPLGNMGNGLKRTGGHGLVFFCFKDTSTTRI